MMNRLAPALTIFLTLSAHADALPMKDKTYSSSKDTAFHAALAALTDVGATVQASDFAGGTIMAQTVSGKLMFVKATNWNVTVEQSDKEKTLVHLDRSGSNTFKSTITADDDPAPYDQFFHALDAEVQKRMPAK